MKMIGPVIVIFLVITCTIIAGCTQPVQKESAPVVPSPAHPVSSLPDVSIPLSPTKIGTANLTTKDLISFVDGAVLYARENGKENATNTFNDIHGRFVSGPLYIFAEGYNGTALAEPFEPALDGTDIGNMTDRFGIPVVRNLEETAHFGKGYVSYDYPNPADNNTVEPKLSVVADVDGTYYVGAGMYAPNGMVYPSTTFNVSAPRNTREDLVSYVKSAVTYAKSHGKDTTIAEFNNPVGQFSRGELVLMALDYNGSILVGPPYSPELAPNHINLINYHDPDGAGTIREMRDLAKSGGGISYTVVKVSDGTRDLYVPKIDYAEPVDDTWWLFSGIIDPGYSRLAAGNLTGIKIRNHTRAEVYDLVNTAVDYARSHGKARTLSEINDPNGTFTRGDLFVWAESFNGTLLADPYFKGEIGNNHMDYIDPNGQKTTVVAMDSLLNNTGFIHEMFPDTSVNGTTHLPKLVYMKAVDDTWWIGSGIYGVDVTDTR